LVMDIRNRLSKRLAGFRLVGVALAVFLAVNISVFVVLSIWPDLIEWLRLSADRPWGIVTSAFSHVDFYHLESNIEGFALASLFFLLTNLVNSRAARRQVSRRFLIVVFVAGIGANLLEYPLALANPGDSSWGASGIVYGALGVLLSSAVQSLPANMNRIKKERRQWTGKRRARRIFRFDKRSLRMMPSLMSFSILVSIMILLVFDAGTFLSVAPNVDVFAHGVGFLLGFLGFTVMQLVDRRRVDRIALRRALRT